MKVSIRTSFGEFQFDGTVDDIKALLKEAAKTNMRGSIGEQNSPILESSVEQVLSHESKIAFPCPIPDGFKYVFRTDGEKDEIAGKLKSQYVYLVRTNDPSNYITQVVNQKGKVLDRVYLGSMKDPNSRLGQFITSLQPLSFTETITRSGMEERLKEIGWSHGRKTRCALDVLLHEHMMEEGSRQTKPVEYRKKDSSKALWSDLAEHLLPQVSTTK
jgi:hypothetical protein